MPVLETGSSTHCPKKARSPRQKARDGPLVFWNEDPDGNLRVTLLEAYKILDIYGDSAVEKLDEWVYAARLSEHDLTNAIETQDIFDETIYRYRRVTANELADLEGSQPAQLSPLDSLRKQLGHPNDKIRFAAALEIADMGADAISATPDLVEIVDDFNRLWPDTRDRTPYAAARALASIGNTDDAVLDVLRQMRDGPGAEDPEARRVAQDALATLAK